MRVSSVIFGDFIAHPRAVAELQEPVDALIVATKAAGLEPALERIRRRAHASCCRCSTGSTTSRVLRRRFAADSVLAGSIRVEADRPQPGVVVHTSPFLLVEHGQRRASRAPGDAGARGRADRGGRADARAGLRGAGDVVEARAPQRARLHHQRLRQAARRDPLNARACAPIWSGRSRRPARSAKPRARTTSTLPSPLTSSSARTTRLAARCSATSPPGASLSSTLFLARCCVRARDMGSRVRRSSGLSR